MSEQLSMFADALQPGEYTIPAGEPSRCAGCGASIAWTRTTSGKAIPLDLSTARTVNDQRVAVTHFASCPQGKEWRR